MVLFRCELISMFRGSASCLFCFLDGRAWELCAGWRKVDRVDFCAAIIVVDEK